MANTKIFDASAPGQSTVFNVTVSDIPTALYGETLSAGEPGNIQFSPSGDPDAGDWADYYRDGTQVQMTDTNNAVTVDAGGVWRIDFPALTSGAKIYMRKAKDA